MKILAPGLSPSSPVAATRADAVPYHRILDTTRAAFAVADDPLRRRPEGDDPMEDETPIAVLDDSAPGAAAATEPATVDAIETPADGPVSAPASASTVISTPMLAGLGGLVAAAAIAAGGGSGSGGGQQPSTGEIPGPDAPEASPPGGPMPTPPTVGQGEGGAAEATPSRPDGADLPPSPDATPPVDADGDADVEKPSPLEEPRLVVHDTGSIEPLLPYTADGKLTIANFEGVKGYVVIETPRGDRHSVPVDLDGVADVSRWGDGFYKVISASQTNEAGDRKVSKGIDGHPLAMFVLDTQAPASVRLSLSDTDPLIPVQAVDVGLRESGAVLRYRLDGGEWVSLPAEVTSLPASVFSSAGLHKLEMVQEDLAGNVSAPTVLHLFKSADGGLVELPAGSSASTLDRPIVSVNDTGPKDEHPVTSDSRLTITNFTGTQGIVYVEDPSGQLIALAVDANGVVDVGAGSDGQYRVVHAGQADAEGHWTYSSVAAEAAELALPSFVLDRQAPDLWVSGIGHSIQSVVWARTDEPNAVLYYQVDGGDWHRGHTDQNLLELLGGPGQHEILMVFQDLAGNLSQAVTWGFFITEEGTASFNAFKGFGSWPEFLEKGLPLPSEVVPPAAEGATFSETDLWSLASPVILPASDGALL